MLDCLEESGNVRIWMGHKITYFSQPKQIQREGMRVYYNNVIY